MGHAPTPFPAPVPPSRDVHPARDRPPAQNVKPALGISDVQKAFDGRPAPDGIDLVVRPGETGGLPGPNGTAKTTLLSMMFALNPPGQRDHQRLRCPVGSPGAAHSTAGLLEPVFWPYLSGRSDLRAFARLDDAASAFAGGETVVRAVLAGMIVVPFAFAGGPLLQESVPADTLFRRWALISGFASPPAPARPVIRFNVS